MHKINKKDRELIDEALKEGRVTVIPEGVSGLPLYFTGKGTHEYVMNKTTYGYKNKNKLRREKIIRMLNNGVEVSVIAKSMRILPENLEKVIQNYAHAISTVNRGDT